MHLTSLLFMVPLHASLARAGSQLWETSAAMPKGSENALLKRAVSIVASDDPDGNAGVHRWPEKTITYAFSTTAAEEKLDRIVEDVEKLWNQLKINGFDYKKLDMKKCKARRRECLVIYYNDHGKLSTTVDAVINAAHELGHAWGLWHEH
ncbi:uncharacterized protein FTOL_00801 [Fusarium torulosum]|uniref:Peptidase M10 metallopeptidase domain-containing protein n=1 Tax=Fusarium torulosum TaxID=33205 RepID=A0AAE8LZ33_9HYPO|nr:uncharacterized protein FTOL_00801 [Fusarium torulosum]